MSHAGLITIANIYDAKLSLYVPYIFMVIIFITKKLYKQKK